MMKQKWLLFMLLVIGIPLLANAQGSDSQTALLIHKEESKTGQLTSLGNELRRLETSYEVNIFYKSKEVQGKQVMASAGSQEGLEASLSLLLEPLNMQYRKLTPKSYVVFEKEKEIIKQETVEGTVTDQTGETLPGVNVLVKGTTSGTSTDVRGTFELSVPSLQDTLVFSFIGYQTQEVPIAGRTTIDVALQPQAITGEEVVVVGYGRQEKVSVTNAVSSVSSEDVSRRPVADAQQSLQGLSSGVTVRDQGGSPGDKNISIRIRGVTTLSNNDPLVIVDGIEQRFSDVNPDDIESISVLKDASSTAIYGSRAANGVVLITTKRASSSEVNVDYKGYYAIQDAINRPEHIGLEEYFRLENVAYQNAGREVPYSEAYIQEYVQNAPSPEYPLPFPWFRRDDLGILELAPQQNHTLAVSGGGEDIKARMSVRYQDVGGIVPNFSDETKEFRLNTDYTPSEQLKVSADLNYRSGETHEPGDGEFKVFNYMLHATKFSWPKYESGEYGLGPQVNNPLLFAEQTGDFRYQNDYLIGNIKGEYEFLPNLTFSTRYALRYSSTQQKRYWARYSNRDPLTDRFTQRQTNYLQEYRSYLREYTLNSLLEYTNDFGKHGVTALAGYSTVDNRRNRLTASRQDFYNNQVRSLNQGSEENKGATGRDFDYGLRSFFSRFNYNYAGKYLVELNARYDGSSRFSKDNRYSFFPSFSLGWRLSQESFWDQLKPYVNEFKLRGSYGATGNQAVDLYTYYQTLAAVNYTFDGEPVAGYAQSRLANQNLTWETTTQTNIGFDMEMMDSRLGLSVDYYKKVTDDILLGLPIPRLIGLSAPPQNAGTVENEGYEITIDYKGGNEFTYDIGLNFSDNKNEVIDLAGTGPYISGSSPNPTFITKEGMPISSHWGYLADGLFQSQEEADSWPDMAMNSNPKPGDVKYRDLNNDGVVNTEDRTDLGRSFPRFNYGLNMGFNYKNFELFTQWQGAAGHEIMISGGLNHQATYEAFTHAIYADYWTPENTDARFPRPIKGDTKNRQVSNRTVYSADYLKLKNVTLTYNIPTRFTEKVSLDRASIYIGATDVLTFSELTEWDLDPEIPSGRANFYPQVRTYTVGVNLRF
ncbi:SusC/RagA family TonB-linked outer membrane protein [Fodinibius salsisoli]|uniref:TonB-dependent receptor n=1 Tax=Fodinibius salsisoli TaxID=2820877 RepID=A0ABT3PL06_9BACT|nr:TonB-dependent receptor [Fodinibius salsisoli]MCW9706625.1 TonB-dependent receptor [Fodinibius salsisoli]